MPRGAPKAHLVSAVPADGWREWSSSNVIGGRFDPATGTLWIKFGDNQTGKARPVTFYVYASVPPAVWEGLLAAPSKGTFHSAQIKNRFPYSGPIAG